MNHNNQYRNNYNRNGGMRFNHHFNENRSVTIEHSMAVAQYVTETRKVHPSQTLLNLMSSPFESYEHFNQQSGDMYRSFMNRKYLSFNMMRKAVVGAAVSADKGKPDSLPKVVISPTRVTFTMEIHNRDYPDLYKQKDDVDNIAMIMKKTNTMIHLADRVEPNKQAPYKHQVVITGEYDEVEEARKLLREIEPVTVYMNLEQADIPKDELHSLITTGALIYDNVIVQAVPTNNVVKPYSMLRIVGRKKHHEYMKKACDSLLGRLFITEQPTNIFSTDIEFSPAHWKKIQSSYRSGFINKQVGLIATATHTIIRVPGAVFDNICSFVIQGTISDVLRARHYMQGNLPVSMQFDCEDDELRAGMDNKLRQLSFYDNHTRVRVLLEKSDKEPTELLRGECIRHKFTMETKEFNVVNLYAAYKQLLKESLNIKTIELDDYTEVYNLLFHTLSSGENTETEETNKMETFCTELPLKTPEVRFSSSSSEGSAINYPSPQEAFRMQANFVNLTPDNIIALTSKPPPPITAIPSNFIQFNPQLNQPYIAFPDGNGYGVQLINVDTVKLFLQQQRMHPNIFDRNVADPMNIYHAPERPCEPVNAGGEQDRRYNRDTNQSTNTSVDCDLNMTNNSNKPPSFPQESYQRTSPGPRRSGGSAAAYNQHRNEWKGSTILGHSREGQMRRNTMGNSSNAGPTASAYPRRNTLTLASRDGSNPFQTSTHFQGNKVDSDESNSGGEQRLYVQDNSNVVEEDNYSSRSYNAKNVPPTMLSDYDRPNNFLSETRHRNNSFNRTEGFGFRKGPVEKTMLEPRHPSKDIGKTELKLSYSWNQGSPNETSAGRMDVMDLITLASEEQKREFRAMIQNRTYAEILEGKHRQWQQEEQKVELDPKMENASRGSNHNNVTYQDKENVEDLINSLPYGDRRVSDHNKPVSYKYNN